MATSTITIPEELGVGGAYLAPGGTTGVPALKTILEELQAAANAAARFAPPHWQKDAADSAAGTTTAELAFYRADVDTTLLTAYLSFDAAVTGHDTNNASIVLRKRDADGTNAVDIATFTTDVASGGFDARAPKTMGTLTAGTMLAGQVLTLEITKLNSGVQLPKGFLHIDAEPTL